LGVLDEVMKHAIRMPGRVIHSRSGALQFQAYGKKVQLFNFSISVPIYFPHTLAGSGDL
jgi:hypothetical protein